MLYQRVLTGVIGGALYLGVVWYGGVPFILLLALLATVGYSELVRMRGFGTFCVPALLGYLVTFAMVTSPLWRDSFDPALDTDPSSMFGLVLILFTFLTISVITKNRYTFQDMTYLFAGTLYVGLAFLSATLLRTDEELGLHYFLFLQILMWSTDTFAYFVGRAVKGPKIWPAISPNKTVSGSVGGVMAAMGAGAVFAQMYDLEILPWLLLSASLSVVGQLGDFVESGLKRSLDVKDSGKILPGHGGVLDRFDSLIFSAPLAYYSILAFVN
jgi:phosphatidate cytidylyltransferase